MTEENETSILVLSQVVAETNIPIWSFFMIAKIHSFNYDAGEYTKTQGHKGYERTHYRNGKYINPTGFGWASEYRPSRITIGICVDGAYAEVWIDRFFKDNWGRLTTKRLTTIRDTMPEEVNVEKK